MPTEAKLEGGGIKGGGGRGAVPGGGRRTRAAGNGDARQRSLAAPGFPQPRSRSDAHGRVLRLRLESSSCGGVGGGIRVSSSSPARHCRAWARRSLSNPSSRHEQLARGAQRPQRLTPRRARVQRQADPTRLTLPATAGPHHGHCHHCVPASSTTTTSATAVSAAVVSPAACLEGRFHPIPSALWALTTWRPVRRRKGSAHCPGSAGMVVGARPDHPAPE